MQISSKAGFQRDNVPLAEFEAEPHYKSVGDTLEKDVSAARMLFEMGKAALLKKGELSPSPYLPKIEGWECFARCDERQGRCPLTPQTFEKV